MDHCFIWNATSAEQVREASARALEAQSGDMRRTAQQILEVANRREEEAQRLEARLPIMRPVYETYERYIGDGRYEVRTNVIGEEEDLAARASIMAQVNEIRRLVVELRNSARQLDA